MRQIDETNRFKRREVVAVIARAEIQRTTHARGFADLLGDDGPADETADEMIQAIRKWRDTPFK